MPLSLYHSKVVWVTKKQEGAQKRHRVSRPGRSLRAQKTCLLFTIFLLPQYKDQSAQPSPNPPSSSLLTARTIIIYARRAPPRETKKKAVLSRRVRPKLKYTGGPGIFAYFTAFIKVRVNIGNATPRQARVGLFLLGATPDLCVRENPEIDFQLHQSEERQ